MGISSSNVGLLLATTALTVMSILPTTPVSANPVDGVVSAGSASIANGDKTVDVTQHSDRAVIDWRGFNIGVDEQTRFFQPNSNSIIVNRVNDANPSQILGKLQANGNVVLINPNGVFFGQGSVVDVNGMLATTADIDNNAFMAGSNNFNKASSNSNASIISNGLISAKDAGLVGLVAPNVVNNGIINVKLGRVDLASGDTVTFDFRGNGLTEIAASDAVKSQLVKNTGAINAKGGTIAITAATGKNIVDNLIDIKGELKAPSFSEHDGKIQIFAAGTENTVSVTGTLDASGYGTGEHGGDVTVTGKNVIIKSGATIDTSGDTGGGNIKIGGDAHGQGLIPTAKTTTIEKNAVLKNNAVTNGNGGTTIVWSDDTTNFAGKIEAKGGSQSGKGGFVETSGKNNLTTTGDVDLRASDGSAGTWLLDPTNISIVNRSQSGTADQVNTISNNYIETQSITADISLSATSTITLDMTGDTPLTLANNRSITLTAGGNIIGNSASQIVTSGTGAISLIAGGDINISGGALKLTANGSGNVLMKSVGNILVTATGNAVTTNGGSIVVNSNSGGANTGNISINATSSFVSHGGDIVFGGGTDPTTGYAFKATIKANGINLSGTTLDATGTSTGGNIIINGQTNIASSSLSSGVTINTASVVKTNFNGAITIKGINTNTGTSSIGMGISTYDGSLISTEAGTITLQGTGGAGTGGNNMGIIIGADVATAPADIIQSTTGAINLTGVGGNGTGSSYGIAIGAPNVATGIFSNSGNITLTGSSTGGSAGILNGSVTPATSGKIGNASTTGTITYISDLFPSVITTQTTGNVIFKPLTTTRAINVATGSANLFLSSATLNAITAGNLIIGSTAGNGLITVGAYTALSNLTFLSNNGNVNFAGTQTLGTKTLTATTSGTGDIILGADITSTAASGTPITLTSAHDIKTSATGTLMVAGTSALTLTAGNDINFSTAYNLVSNTGGITLKANNTIVEASTGGITTQGAAIVINADADASGAGAVSLGGGSYITNGGNFTIGGGLTPATGYTVGTSSNFSGVYLSSTIIDTSGTSVAGDISIYGKGNAAATGATITTEPGGVILTGATLTTNLSGKVTLNGIGGGSGAATGDGIVLDNSSVVTVVNGDLTVTGTAGNTTGSGVLAGIRFSSFGTNKLTTVGAGSLSNFTITGTGGTGTNNYGISSDNQTGFAPSGIYFSNGSATITATTASTTSYGLNSASTGFRIGAGSAVGQLTMILNSINPGGNTQFKTTGNITFKPITNTSIINVGGVTASTTNLNLTNSILAGILTGTGSVTIGSNAQQGNITVTTQTWSLPVNFLTSSGNITFSGAQTLGTNALTAVTGTGDISLGASITSSATSGSAITLTSGHDILTSGNGTLTIAGTSTLTLTAGNDINFSNAYNLIGNTGGITLKANNNIIESSTGGITTSGGALVLNADADGSNIGAISLAGGSYITNGGNITMAGGATATGMLYGSATTPNGIRLTGTTINANGTATGGNIVMKGTGYLNSTDIAGSGTAATGIYDYGSTIQTNFTGTIAITAVGGGTGVSSGNAGIYFNNGSTISTVNGNITISATGGGGSASAAGFQTSTLGTNLITSTGAGNISMTGTGGGSSGTNNNGILFYNANSGFVNTTGTLTLTGIGGFGSAGIGNYAGTGGVIGNASTSGAITLITDSTSLDYTTLPVKTTGNVVIKPYTTSTAINVSTGSTGLYLPTNFLNNITAGSITIGSLTDTGLMTVGAQTWTAPVTFLNGTNNITFTGIQTTSGKDITATVSGSGNKITTSVMSVGAGNITLTSDDITIGGALSGTGTITLQNYTTGRSISINDYTQSADNGTRYFLDTTEIGNLTDGWTSIVIGNSTATGEIRNGAITFTDPVVFKNAGNVVIGATLTGTGNSSFTFNPALSTYVRSNITTAGQAVTFNSAIIADSGTTPVISTSNGAVSVSGTTTIGSGGNGLMINAGNGNITLTGAVTNSGSTAGKTLTLNAGTGTVAFGSTVNGAFNLTATGNSITSVGAWGATTGLGDITLTAVNNLNLPAITTATGKTVNATASGAGNKITTAAITTGTGGNITLTSDDVTIGGNLSGTGTLTLQPYTSSREVRVNHGTDNGTFYYLDTAELGRLTDGWNLINVSNASNNVTTKVNVSTWTDPVVFRSGAGTNFVGAFTGTGNASITTTGGPTGIYANVTLANGNYDASGASYTYFGVNNGTISTGGGNAILSTISIGNGFNGSILTSGGNITTTAGTIVLNSNAGKTLTFNAGTGNVTSNSVVTGIGNISVTGNTITLNNAWGDGTTSIGTLTLTAANSMTLPAITALNVIATVTGAGNKITTGAITTGTGGKITLTSDDVAIGGNLSGTGTLTLQPYANARQIYINNGVDDGSKYHLNTTELGYLADGWNQINIGNDANTTNLFTSVSTWKDPIVFHNAAGVNIVGNLTGSGNASFATAGNGSADISADITTAGGAVNFNGSSYLFTTGTTITTNGGTVSLPTITLGALGSTGMNVVTNGGNINLGGQLQTNSSSTGKTVTLNAGTGNVSFANTVTGTANVTANGTNLTFGGAWGTSGTPLGSVTLTAVNNLTLPAIFASSVNATTTGAGNKITTGTITTGTGNITLTSDDITLGGAMTGTGTLTLQQNANNRTFNIGNGADDGSSYYIGLGDINNITDGWSTINLGKTTSTAAFNLAQSSWKDPIVFRNGSAGIQMQPGGYLTGTDNASFVFVSTGGANLEGDNITTAGGKVDLTGVSYIYTTGTNVTTNGGNASFATVTLGALGAGGLNVNTSGGNIAFAGQLQTNSSSTGKTVTLNAGTGNVSFANTVTGTANITANGTNLTFAGAWGTSGTPLGAVNLTSINSVSLPAINASSVLVKATGALAGITTAGQITTTATGDALVLSGHSFTNNFGSTALNPTNGGRFLVWSSDPAADSRNGIAYTFKQYNASYGVTSVAGSGSGFLYTLAPTLSIALQNTVDKQYDGTNTAALGAGNYIVTSNVDGDTITINGGTAVYNDKNVGSNKNVSVSGITFAAANGAATVYGYQANTTANANIGNISAASLTVTANDATKVYGTTLNFTGSEFTTIGLIGTDSVTSLTLNSSGTLATAPVAGSPYNIVGSNATGSGLSNYNITYVDGHLSVTPASLTITVNDATKVYGTALNFTGTEFTTNGLVNTDSVTAISMNSSGSTGTATVTGSPYNIVGSNATGSGLSNYNITYVNGHLSVTPASLTIAGLNYTKQVGQAINLLGTDFTVTGLLNSDNVSLANVSSSGAASGASAGLYSVIVSNASGGGLSNYNITYSDGSINVLNGGTPPVTVPTDPIDPGTTPSPIVTTTALPKTVEITSQNPNDVLYHSTSTLTGSSIDSPSLVDIDVATMTNERDRSPKPVSVMNNLVEIDPRLFREIVYDPSPSHD